MHWNILDPDRETIRSIQSSFKTSAVIARILANRNLRSNEEAGHFLDSNLDRLHDPYLMMDMEKSVGRILKNIRFGKPIMVFGDYDVDGTTGAASLYISLTTFGADATYYIPDRDKEGYGLSPKGILTAKDNGIDLIITCDCGINAFDQVRYANELGVDIIITDHHTPGERLPKAFAVLNPKRIDCQYPFKGLCGGGVAFKLITALAKELNTPFNDIEEILPLITLGTAADIVPIKDENRIIVNHGLKMMSSIKRPGFKALLELSGLSKNITVGKLIFGIAPRINAAGRLGDANRAVECMVTTDEQRGMALAKELDEENKRRQVIQQQVVNEAFLKVNAEADLERERALVLADEGWHQGVVGIVASRVREKFHRPAVIIAMENGKGKGSARSVKGFDLYSALSECKDLLDGYGGHPMAAGLSVSKKHLDGFRSAFLEVANEWITDEQLQPMITLDSEIILQDITPRFMDFLDKLSPYGPGNMRPKFALLDCTITGRPKVIGKTGEHIRFQIKQGMRSISAVGFGLADKYEMLITGEPLDVACVVETNEWQGNVSTQLNIRDIRRSES